MSSLLFTCVCNQPERLLSAIEPVRDVLRSKDIERWGLSYVQAGEVLLSRHPKAVTGPFDFFEVLGSLQSDYVIGVASDNREYRGNANTQPFRYKHWMLGLQSDIENFSEVHAKLMKPLPGFLQRNIKGKSPAEVVLHHVLAILHTSGRVDDHNLATQASADALLEAVDVVRGICDEAGLRGSIGNIMLSNSRSTVVAKLGTPLHFRLLKETVDPKRPETEFRSVLVVSAAGGVMPERDGCDEQQSGGGRAALNSVLGEGFEALPDNSVLCIHRDLSTDLSTF